MRLLNSGLFVARQPPLAARDALMLVVPDPCRNAACSLACALGAKLWVGIWSNLAQTGKIPPVISRKIIHSGSAPLFLLFWPLYADDASARFIAAMVPLLQIFRLYRAGQADATGDAGLVRAVSRSGVRQEALGGPLLYSIVLLCATILGWRNLTAAVAVCQMAVGDGVADIFGRRFGKVKWPIAPSKSIVGSTAFTLGAFIASACAVALFHGAGYTLLTAASCLPALFVISVLSALVELMPGLDDNLSVPLFAAVASSILLR